MSEDEIILPVQHMFPNCEKYKKCCTKDEEFWEGLQKKVKKTNLKSVNIASKKITIKHSRAPKGFRIRIPKGY